MKYILLILTCFIGFSACNSQDHGVRGDNKLREKVTKVVKSNKEWKELLTSEQYHITREEGTEAPFSGKYNDFKGKGIYKCVSCGNPLFSSATKFNSGTGWPSYYEPLNDTSVIEDADRSLGMLRTEVLCMRCDAHLGHVFEDGPKPTGLRYCINSAALIFEEK